MQVCLALLKLKPGEDWLAAFFKRALAVLPQSRPIEVATVLTGAAALGVHPGWCALACDGLCGATHALPAFMNCCWGTIHF